MRAIIISNGNIDNYSFYKDKFVDSDYIICADGAIRHCVELGIVPDIWIGDFDSCNYDNYCRQYPELIGVDTVKLNKDKDETDTHIACNIAIDKGCDDILIWGALGKRADHMLSNIHLLEALNKKKITAIIEDENNTISVFDSVYVTKKHRKYLSLIPLDANVTVIKTEGLLYPLENYVITRDISLGVSNEVVDTEAKISICGGLMLAIHSND